MEEKQVGRVVKRFDWYGWIMCILGLVLMYIAVVSHSWFLLGVIILFFLDYVWRVSFGRVFMVVCYDTIIRHMYQVKALYNDEMYYVCAEDEEQLVEYMRLYYKGIDYVIMDTLIVESFIKQEKHM